MKAGTTGSLKSLSEFIIEKNKTIAVRVNSDKPSICVVQTNDRIGKSIKYRLLSLHSIYWDECIVSLAVLQVAPNTINMFFVPIIYKIIYKKFC